MESLARLQDDGNAWEEWNQLFHHIRMGDLDGAKQLFDDSFLLLSPPCADNLEDAKSFWKSAVFFVFLSLSNSNGQRPKEFPESLWKVVHTIERSQDGQAVQDAVCMGMDKIREDFFAVGSRQSKMAKEAISFIENNFQKKLTERDIINHLRVSKTWFYKAFRDVTRTTFWEYLQRRRLRECISLLKSTDKSLQTISVESGFTSTRSMHNAFKKYLGKSISEIKDFEVNIPF